jgi:hypothetical protein
MIINPMENFKMKNNNDLIEYNIAILTPSLTESVECFDNPIHFIQNLALYGYDPDNLNGIKLLSTDKGNIVRIWSPEYDGLYREDVRKYELENSDLVIAGSTERGEYEVNQLKDSGLIVARYSIFYGSRSGYSSEKPEETGYSIDIPKSVTCVNRLLQSDKTLEAIASRDESRIISAIDELNSGNESYPILITPYLTKALEVGGINK